MELLVLSLRSHEDEAQKDYPGQYSFQMLVELRNGDKHEGVFDIEASDVGVSKPSGTSLGYLWFRKK
ncbi:hypothetical protein AB4090_13025 [Acidithiobacillus sp. IBUN Pt1247-S3]|uniref:hypothetical protein n=1 Tax=Acidithiobacillus sp. IBUN Pt1247-S3 TaxID=3166642 RepID=UPI0034E3E0B9